MDLLANLFNPNEEVQTYRVTGGQVDGAVVVQPPEQPDTSYEAQKCSANYAEVYQRREEQLYKRSMQEKANANMTVRDFDDISSISCPMDVEIMEQEEKLQIFSKYRFDKQQVEELVIDSFRDEILEMVRLNEVVIIQGPTGCGKTTRVPQFILDNYRAHFTPCNIVITQPRRIAAISVARRVCEERGWALGSVCGYKVGLEVNASSDTLLTYVTTGVLLQKLIKQRNLTEYTHIIIDEVHERNQDMDFLLLVIRRFLKTNSMHTKIILMSATFDTSTFANYFKDYNSSELKGAPVLNIDRASKYCTQKFFADQLQVLLKTEKMPQFDITDPKIYDELYKIFVRLVRVLDKLDTVDPVTNKRVIGNVLVFLPGLYEIEEAHNRLTTSSMHFKDDPTVKIDWHILPLHSSITTEEQKKVFKPPPPGKRKIILSTNIAESSITVPDIVYVIDFCLTKVMMMDPESQYQTLRLQWASQDNCVQRAGRVGRVADGRVYHLVPIHFYENYLSKSIVPEILRAPLSQTVLHAKMLEFNEPPKAILALAMDPPNLINIDNTVLLLKEIGALHMTCNEVNVIYDGDLTFIGTIMAHLPLDVHLSKFIILGHMFNCLHECIIMATGCTLSIFKSPFRDRVKAYHNLLRWADGSCSDLVAYLHLYRVWQSQHTTHGDWRLEKEWTKRNYVSQKTLREWQMLVLEIEQRLKSLKIVSPEGGSRLCSTELSTVIKVIACGAFYPNYFTRSSDGGQIDEREAVKTLNGRDPCNTIYFTGFNCDQPGPLYTKHIKRFFPEYSGNIRVSFDHSNKVYVEFLNQNFTETVTINGQKFVATMPGNIRTEVYGAVRMRQTIMKHSIPILSKREAMELAERLGLDKLFTDFCNAPNYVPRPPPAPRISDPEQIVFPPVLPAMDVEFIRIIVSTKVDAGHFWVHNVDEDTFEAITLLETILNREPLQPVKPETVVVGGVYVALYDEDKKYYRAKVISLKHSLALILFIDYGNTKTLQLKHLFTLPNHNIFSRPGLAIECMLSEIQPSAVLDPRALWCKEANDEFEVLTCDKILFAKVYSVVNGIVNLELYKPAPDGRLVGTYDRSLNYYLVKKGYAQPAEESFLSKENHMKRQHLLENPDKRCAMLKEEEEAKLRENMEDIDVPDNLPCHYMLELKGPFSPLEMKIYPLVASSLHKQVTIEGNSVNTVLLDSDPQDPHERLVVAAHIGQQANRAGLTLRHTTIMPNVHGFTALMSLLFCPRMEPKPTADGDRIAAILCGLGAHDQTNTAIYAQHDICLTLDTDLTAADINHINSMRHYMNISIDTMKAYYQESATNASMAYNQQELLSRLFSLLKFRRRSAERIYVQDSNVWGKLLYDGYILEPNEGNRLLRTEIWPLHWTVKTKKDISLGQQLDAYLEELKQLSNSATGEIVCLICNLTLKSGPELKIHLGSKMHCNNVDLQKHMEIAALTI